MLSTQLRRTGLWATTLLVFSGDNGGYLGSGGDNHPRRGGKFSDFNGGVRVAAFVSGGYLPAAVRGTQQSGMIHIADWHSTFLGLAEMDWKLRGSGSRCC